MDGEQKKKEVTLEDLAAMMERSLEAAKGLDSKVDKLDKRVGNLEVKVSNLDFEVRELRKDMGAGFARLENRISAVDEGQTRRINDSELRLGRRIDNLS